jgi:hypothetical protein
VKSENGESVTAKKKEVNIKWMVDNKKLAETTANITVKKEATDDDDEEEEEEEDDGSDDDDASEKISIWLDKIPVYPRKKKKITKYVSLHIATHTHLYIITKTIYALNCEPH